MKTRWLVLLACLMVTACSNPDDATSEPKTKQESTTTDSKAKDQPAASTEVKPEATQPAPKAEAKVDPKPEVKAETKPEPKPEPKTEAKKEAQPEPKKTEPVKPQQEPKIDPKPKAEPKAEPKKADAKPDAASKPEKPKSTKIEPSPPGVAETQPASRIEQANGLAQKYAAAQIAYQKAMQAAAPEDRNQVRIDTLPVVTEYADEFMKLVADNDEDEAAFTSLAWIAANIRSGESNEKALDLLFTKHLDNEGLKIVCMGFSRVLPSPITTERLNLLIENSPHNSVKANATYAKAKYLGRFDMIKEYIKGNAEHGLGDEVVTYLDTTDVSPKDLENLYVSLEEDFPELKVGKRTFKEAVEGPLYELRNLAIGMEVPDIEHVDFDDTTFKLSDYRGKIVLIDFWGDW